MDAPKRFVIIGGGTAGWMAAAALARVLRPTEATGYEIILIESEEIGVVGVGEATIPPILDFLKFLNIAEADFIKATNGTYKLAIEFVDWRIQGHSYWHPFGTLGPSIENRPLFQHWLRARQEEGDRSELMSLSIATQLAMAGRFTKPSQNDASSLGGLAYALHFDAVLAAHYWRNYSQNKGVARLEGKVVEVNTAPSGDIASVKMENGPLISGDFFIDCTGFRALLIEKTLGSDFENWAHWLPCDRAVAVQSESKADINPYTISTARDAGWTWQIPLQNRIGNGYVYASRFASAEDAENLLLSSINSEPLTQPRHLSFCAGRRQQTWVKNCLSLGLASGFLEPLESTSIHLVFANLFRFLEFFPGAGGFESARCEFNRRAVREIEEIRDFLILHYCLSKRRDTPFWRYVTEMELPESLKTKIDAFTNSGRITTDFYDLFKPFSWISVYDGMGLKPAAFDPLIAPIPKSFSEKVLANVRAQIQKDVQQALPHKASLL